MDTITKDQGDKIIGLLGQILIALNAMKDGGAMTASGRGGSADPNFREGVFTGWKAARVPSWTKFDRGVQFGDLSGKSLDYWINTWQPNGYQGNPPKPEDVALRKLLDEAKAEVDSGAYVPPKYTNKPKEPKADRPAPRRETPVDQGQGGGQNDNGDSDVPF
jgi:hypothetical protein